MEWTLPGETKSLNLHTDGPPEVNRRIREALRRRAWKQLEAGRGDTFRGIAEGVDRYATLPWLNEGHSELDKSLIRRATAGSRWMSRTNEVYHPTPSAHVARLSVRMGTTFTLYVPAGVLPGTSIFHIRIHKACKSSIHMVCKCTRDENLQDLQIHMVCMWIW